jgi:hypothetical protein
MNEEELESIIGKARKIKALRRAKMRVQQLERELRGEPAKPEEPPYVPEFLRTRVTNGPAKLTFRRTSSESLSAGGPRDLANGLALRADRWPNPSD